MLRNTPPFPEDSVVADWVLRIAEPQGIVNKHQNIFVDESPLVIDPHREPEQVVTEPEKQRRRLPVRHSNKWIRCLSKNPEWSSKVSR
ncbi:MAG: hypothetical protein IPN33_25750 [Saprospiraceae bacterium]|nr:hypothetical protein [Saprospiraceae bacterium]